MPPAPRTAIRMGEPPGDGDARARPRDSCIYMVTACPGGGRLLAWGHDARGGAALSLCLQHPPDGDPGGDAALRRRAPGERPAGDPVQHARADLAPPPCQPAAARGGPRDRPDHADPQPGPARARWADRARGPPGPPDQGDAPDSQGTGGPPDGPSALEPGPGAGAAGAGEQGTGGRAPASRPPARRRGQDAGIATGSGAADRVATRVM